MKYLKYLQIIFAGLFITFAIVQLNDPDAGLWMAAYSAATLVCILNFLEKMPKNVLLGAIGVTVLGILVLMPNAYSSVVNYDPNLAPDPSVTHTANVQTEIFKEFGGLFVILSAFVIHYFTIRKIG